MSSARQMKLNWMPLRVCVCLYCTRGVVHIRRFFFYSFAWPPLPLAVSLSLCTSCWQGFLRHSFLFLLFTCAVAAISFAFVTPMEMKKGNRLLRLNVFFPHYFLPNFISPFFYLFLKKMVGHCDLYCMQIVCDITKRDVKLFRFM